MAKLYYHKAMDIEFLSDGKLNAIIDGGKGGKGEISELYKKLHTKIFDREWDLILIILCAVFKGLDIYMRIKS